MQSTVSRWGNSLAIRLPKGLAEDAALSNGTAIDFQLQDGAIVIRAARPQVNLDELLDRFLPEHRHGEFDVGEDVGAERWE